MVRQVFFGGAFVTFVAVAGIFTVWPPIAWSLVIFIPLFLLGVHDVSQKNHTILRNFPVIGHGRYLLESIRPEIQQYFIEMDTAGMPLSREERSVVYQRAKNELDTVPFGTKHDVYETGFEWVNHSLNACEAPEVEPRVVFGENSCERPYASSLLNISAMSFGALSPTAVLALNGGAKLGNFAHNTGEGGISPYHLEPGGDLIWQIGTGYFGCRTLDGAFDPEMFKANASQETVRMIELKLSQGAKPGHGGILPGEKVNKEIAEIRGVPVGKDVLSPPTHSAFQGPIGLLEFVTQLRELSGGKPVGIKLCVGQPVEFLALCKAMLETGLHPDFIAVDGKEGGTGAAPLEFSNSVGMPLREGLRFVHNALVGCNLRSRLKLVASGKVIHGFDILRSIALGADACASARGMMLALGCIQALRCNSNVCPTGIATQDKGLYKGIYVPDKTHRVFRYHRKTVHNFLDLAACAGIETPGEVEPRHLMRRVDAHTIRTYEDLYHTIDEGALLEGDVPEWVAGIWEQARADRF